MRVLIVEDERRLAENIARSLRETAGYAVDLPSTAKTDSTWRKPIRMTCCCST